jgi:hypothetical protein
MPLSLPSGRNDVKGYVWAALIFVVVSLAIVRFTHVTDPIAGTVNLSSREYRMA